MKPYYDEDGVTIYHGDCREVLRALPERSVSCCVTSPPYFGLRDYGHDAQIGLEATPDAYVAQLVAVFREVRRVLRDDGTLWLNLGDSYAGGGGFSPNAPSNLAGAKQTTQGGAKEGGIKPQGDIKAKDLVGIPWRVAFALQADGWYLRQDIIWHKPNPMPESVTDRCTKAHEYIFLLAKSQTYYYDAAAIAEPSVYGPRVCEPGARNITTAAEERRTRPTHGIAVGETRNRRSVWAVATTPYAEAHFATFPEGLILPCILAGSPPGGVVLDPFMGSGTTAYVARKQGRAAIGCELNASYIDLAAKRLAQCELFPAVHDVPADEPEQGGLL